MTKKDYIQLAQVLQGHRMILDKLPNGAAASAERVRFLGLVEAMCSTLAFDNWHFDKERFKAAVYVKVVDPVRLI